MPTWFRSPALPAFALAILLAVPLATPRAEAQASLPPQLVHAELRPGWRGEDGTHIAALHLTLADGWKTYWRIPGEAGIAPQLDWSRSQNAASVRALWPRPVVFAQNGYRSIGYKGELVLPLEVVPQRADRPVALQGEITIGICDEICIPVDLSLAQVLRGGTAPDALIAAALRDGAAPASAAGLVRATCEIAPGAGEVTLTLRAQLPPQGAGETLIVELPGTDYWITQPPSRREGNELVAEARIRAPRGEAIGIERGAVAFTILTGSRMLTHRGCTAGG
jgi:DsbC/DsbD-like thiol-disulfide interchange protein